MRLRGKRGTRDALEQQTDLIVLDPRAYKGRWAERFGNANVRPYRLRETRFNLSSAEFQPRRTMSSGSPGVDAPPPNVSSSTRP